MSRPVPSFEIVDEEMAAVLRQKTGAERLEIAMGMMRSLRNMLESHLRAERPHWSEEQIKLEASRRIAAGGDD
jgi:hypothetical protein